MPGRRERLKSTDPHEAIQEQRTRTILEPHHPNQLTLDIPELAAEQSSRAIFRHIDGLTGRARLERQGAGDRRVHPGAGR